MAGDSVANVRFNVAKTILSISKVLPAAAIQVDGRREQIFFCASNNIFPFQSQVRPCIEKLNTDSDFDVRYYASEASMGKKRARIKMISFDEPNFFFSVLE